ncbi:hypothetical protein SAMD00019534_055690 [Acytostelium subglobosum LB1]|uniref:hypothetical protein n=1 Tax=Acytostelium subglobosum LB1 TaxID=1410327 RepID=UPI000644C477|nr:hypothetical protein SAMD00019534_055690 [Acytostelium subglobosum LB1]GAM22394.1 hypothetical protein SAMD00019534_055690 [Acytostelium subglobosum LB1]|eukprot:XP_012754514.1 hypothetical protein SAMD00019534_055690 [Acytostelium subglobosum LB1]
MKDVLPYFLFFIFVENVLDLFFEEDLSWNDSFTSVATGIVSKTWDLLLAGSFIAAFEYAGTCYMWNNYRLLDYATDNKLASFLCFLMVDIAFYIDHRLTHEVSILWLGHVQHHSAEKFNLIGNLRLSFLKIYRTWTYLIPMGLVFPPQMLFFHLQANNIYQFFLHCKYVPKLGPIEWIFNTPSHHRVHHARNPKYIDMNYGGVLIIWDRILGTFVEEDEECFYGLVHPVNSNDPTWIQLHYIYDMYLKWKQQTTWSHKFQSLLKGPGWRPGSPRLGFIAEIPEPVKGDSKTRIDPPVASSLNLYVVVHCVMVIGSVFVFMTKYEKDNTNKVLALYLLLCYLSITILGRIYDRKKYAYGVELFRLLFLVAFTWTNEGSMVQFLRSICVASSGFMITKIMEPPESILVRA